MRVHATVTYEFYDKEIKEFMEARGHFYGYDEKDVEMEMETITAEECQLYGKPDFAEPDVDIKFC